jgi:uncharacterized spore protein YtfJ
MKRFLYGFLALFLMMGTMVGAETATPALEFSAAFSQMTETLSSNLNSSTCLGTPLQVGELTIIPVVCKGFGIGLGTGMNLHEEAVGNPNNVNKETSKDRKGLGCGGAGIVRTIAILVIKKDGSFQLHRLQENFMAQAIKAFLPVVQKAIDKHFQLRVLKMKASENAPVGAPVAPAPGK